MKSTVRSLLLLGGVIAGLALILIVAVSIVLVRHYGTPVQEPLDYVAIDRDHGQARSIEASLTRGHRLDECVNLTLFDGFDPPVRFDDARRRFGLPSGYGSPRARAAAAEQAQFKSVGLAAPYYDRPGGRVFLRPYRTLQAQILMVPMAFPRRCTLDELFIDPSLRSQIAALLPASGFASLTLHGGETYGRIVVSLNRSGCSDILLDVRDSNG